MLKRRRRTPTANDPTSSPLLDQLRRENEQLRRSVGELSLLNELAIEIGSAGELDAVMAAVVRRARAAVHASQGVITLIEQSDGDDQLRTLVRTKSASAADGALRPSEAIVQWMQSRKSPLVLNEGETRRELPPLDPSVRSLLSVPMIAGGRLEGILTAYNRADNGRFSREDARLLSIIAAQSAQAIQNRRIDDERRRIAHIFGLHTAPEVVDEILQRPTNLSGEKRRACIMFVDIRGFATYAEREAPERVVKFLNAFFDLTLETVRRRHGIVHQLLGDGFMALFGVPVSHESATLNAVESSLEIIDRVDKSAEEGLLPPVEVGIGLHTGDVVAGLVGSALHQEYKVTGDAVNVAARIEGLNKEYGSRVLVSDAVVEEFQMDGFRPASLGRVVLRGRSTPIEIYRLA